MLPRSSELKPQEDKMEITDEQINGSQQNSVSLTNLPDEILVMINDCLPSVTDSVSLASVNLYFHRLFQPKIGKREANGAAECAIYPTEENVEKLIALLIERPPLLFHPVTVKNRHGMVIKGTIYQIALHEGDNELIDDVIKPAFERLNGLETMEVQRKAQFPEGWAEAEEKALNVALKAIDNVFVAFKNASHPNDVTELPEYPHTITIKNQEVNKAIDAFRKAIDALYEPTDEIITSGRDPSVRLLEKIIDRYLENYNAFGGYNTPRNNAIMRSVFGYCQRPAPINFMQAFATGILDIVENEEKLIRSFEYRHWKDHSILPLDLDPLFRLGHEYFAGAAAAGCVRGAGRAGRSRWLYKTFCQSKAAAIQTRIMCNSTQDNESIESVDQVSSWKKYCAIM